MPDDPLIRALREQIATWRDAAQFEFNEGSAEYGKGLDQAADDLAAFLRRAGSEPPPETIRARLQGVVYGWTHASFGGLTSADVLGVQQWWETRPASKQQTDIAVKLAKLREQLERREGQ